MNIYIFNLEKQETKLLVYDIYISH